MQRFFVFGAIAMSVNSAWAAALPSGGAVEANYSRADVVLLLAYVLLALVLSFLCSVAEAVLLSITPSFIEGFRKTRPRRAALLKKLKEENVDRSLAAILTLNTIAHTVGAIGAGAKATIVFGSAWFGLFSAVMTLLILFLSEIIPKTLGALYWPTLAAPTAIFIRWLIIVLYPLIIVSEALTKLLARGKTVHAFSRHEFIAMVGLGEKSGHLDEEESRIIRNLFRFKSLTAADVMTPRTVIVAVDKETTVTEALEDKRTAVFSRLPVYGDGLDDILGFVLKDDMLMEKSLDKHQTKAGELRRDIDKVSKTTSLSSLLGLFLEQRRHMALVVGEYGGTAGLVTLEDVVETLLGMEIVDEVDQIEDMQALARQQWTKRAKAQGIQID